MASATSESESEGVAPWTVRESQLLAVTLELLQEHGYDRLTVDAVAAAARASKKTMYRRWPSKALLVVAAVTEGVRQRAVQPNTGTLRGDLIQVGEVTRQAVREHGTTIVGVLSELRRNPALSDTLRREFVEDRTGILASIVQRAVDRGEVPDTALDNQLWDVLPGYLVYRGIFPGPGLTRQVVEQLVDEVIIPSLSRVRGKI